VPLNQDVDPVSVLVHCPPEVMPLPLDVHEELVQVPDVPQPSLSTLELLGVLGSKLLTPLPDGLIGDDDASLRQELLDVPETQAESVVKPHCVTNDLRGESVSVVAASIVIHPPSLPGSGSS
jgi:hypothetical protein